MILLQTRKRHDTGEPLQVLLTKRKPGQNFQSPADLTNANQALITLTNKATGVIKVNRQTCSIDTPRTNGSVTFGSPAWNPLHVDTSGTYLVDVEVTYTDGSKSTWPSDPDHDYGVIVIRDDLDGV